MQSAMCHYSVHRTFTEESWDLQQLVAYAAAEGFAGIDFHARFLGDRATAAERIAAALDGSGLALVGLSLSNDFNVSATEWDKQVETTAAWIEVAGAVGAPVSRIFGGKLRDRGDRAQVQEALAKVTDALRQLVPVAEQHGVILAIENHGGLPCTGAEQVQVIEAVGNSYCKATLDLGNYLQCPEEPLAGVTAALPYCAYVHVKDFRRTSGGLEATALGEGEVDLRGCLAKIKQSGYDGPVALEYEAATPERQGVTTSLDFLQDVLANL